MDAQRLRDEVLTRLETTAGFVRYVARRFSNDECLGAAATLAYTTLLSLVPLFAVSFTVLTAFPVFEAFNERIQDLLFANLVPASGEVVQSYLQEFASRAAGLTAAGMLGIILAAILMVSAIDKALNRIWRVDKPRRPVQSFMVYWTVITVGPFLVAISLLLSSYLVALTNFAAEEHARGIQEMMLWVTPILAVMAAFTFLYCAVPNRRVPILHALAGGAVAATLFEITKFGFTAFVTSIPTYEAIYGALATLPIFLIWIFLCWVVVLFGAEFTHSLSAYREERRRSFSDPRLSLLLAVRLSGDLWRAQQSGRTMTREQLLMLEPEVGEVAVEESLEALSQARIIRRTEDGQWMLLRDPSTFTLLELYFSSPYVLSEVPPNLCGKDDWNKTLAAVLREAMAGVGHALDRPLQEIFLAGNRAAAARADTAASTGTGAIAGNHDANDNDAPTDTELVAGAGGPGMEGADRHAGSVRTADSRGESGPVARRAAVGDTE